MSNSRMVEAVNRLIGNLLSGAGEVFLPGVGSLYAEQQGAKRVDKHTILPPCRTVSFSSQERGMSLVGEIARAAGVDDAKAEEIYQTWLAQTRGENTLTIEGVGELKFKHFSLAPEFDKILNPAGHVPVKIRVKRGSDWVMWLGVVAILIAVGLFGYQYQWNPGWGIADRTVAQPETVVAVETTVLVDSLANQTDTLLHQNMADAGTVPSETPAETAAAVPAQTGEQTEQSRTSAGETAASRTEGQASGVEAGQEVPATVSGRCYVVLGVFSSKENAIRAAAEAQKKSPQWQCRIYRMGGKYMVSPFEGTTEACAQFIGEDNGAHSGMWPYNAR